MYGNPGNHEEEMSKEDKKAYGDYEGKMMAESDVHTLMEAQAIKANEERHARAMHCAKMKREEMNKVSEGE